MSVSGSIDIADGGVVTGANIVPSRSIQTAAYSTAAGLKSVSVTNAGAANGTLQGVAILPGQSVNYDGYFDEETKVFNRLGVIAMDGTGTSLHVVELA
jgi:hypothetical protein